MLRLRRPVRHALSPRSASRASEAHARVWLLDLDNTLHDAVAIVMPRINRAMTDYVARHLGVSEAQASVLRERYWRRYGATLLGLVEHHDVDPYHFLRETHQFPDLASIVRRDHRLARALAQLRGRRIVVTNAPHHYARAVVRQLGIGALIEGIVSIEAMQFAQRLRPKPSRSMMHRIVARLRVPAARCVLVEDTLANLASVRALGIRTVLVTGLAPALRAAPQRNRVGSSRRAELQVQSVAHLPRRQPQRV